MENSPESVSSFMKISPETISIFKHCASINPGIIVDPGNVIYSMSESRTIRLQATVQENFPVQFALVNLNQFLNTLSLVNSPELEFQDDHVDISSADGKQKFQYWFSDPAIIQQYNKPLKFDVTYDIEFNISREDLSQLNRAASVIGAEDICVYSHENDSEIYVSAIDKQQNMGKGNNFALKIGENTGLSDKSFKIYFRKSNLKLTGNDFTVKVTKGLSTWYAINANVPELLFHIAIERDSEINV